MNEIFPLPKEHSLAAKPARSRQVPTSAGSFSIRRDRYFSEAEKSLLTADQHRVMLKQAREGDLGARRQLIAHNMHLVVDFAKCHSDRGLTLLDLVREGTQGLIHALEKFEPEGGFSFSTYASWCIGHNIERAILNRNLPPAPARIVPALGDAAYNGDQDGRAA